MQTAAWRGGDVTSSRLLSGHCSPCHSSSPSQYLLTASSLYITAHSLSQITASECSYSQCNVFATGGAGTQSALQMSPDLTTSSHTLSLSQQERLDFKQAESSKVHSRYSKYSSYTQVAMLVVCDCRASSPQMVAW